eukprot:SM000030S11321  [mRNA]  locus=s30:135332:137418:+ [translate_table: standard]
MPSVKSMGGKNEQDDQKNDEKRAAKDAHEPTPNESGADSEEPGEPETYRHGNLVVHLTGVLELRGRLLHQLADVLPRLVTGANVGIGGSGAPTYALAKRRSMRQ